MKGTIMDKHKINSQDVETVTGNEPINLTPGATPNTEKKPNGQYKDYWVLSQEERDKGFVQPVRTDYKHLKCGTITKMGLKIAETYARDPCFYGSTFCCYCGDHYPVGENGEFIWIEPDGSERGQKVGTICEKEKINDIKDNDINNYEEISKLGLEQIILLLAKNKISFWLAAPVDYDAKVLDEDCCSFDDLEKTERDLSFCFRIGQEKHCDQCHSFIGDDIMGYGKTPKKAVLDSIKKYNNKILVDSIAKKKNR
jgi:hypothetical protein